MELKKPKGVPGWVRMQKVRDHSYMERKGRDAANVTGKLIPRISFAIIRQIAFHNLGSHVAHNFFL